MIDDKFIFAEQQQQDKKKSKVKVHTSQIVTRRKAADQGVQAEVLVVERTIQNELAAEDREAIDRLEQKLFEAQAASKVLAEQVSSCEDIDAQALAF